MFCFLIPSSLFRRPLWQSSWYRRKVQSVLQVFYSLFFTAIFVITTNSFSFSQTNDRLGWDIITKQSNNDRWWWTSNTLVCRRHFVHLLGFGIPGNIFHTSMVSSFHTNQQVQQKYFRSHAYTLAAASKHCFKFLKWLEHIYALEIAKNDQ